MHWATEYIGRRWKIGGRGPNEFDCWGLVWFLYRERYRIDLPSYVGVSPDDISRVCLVAENESRQWRHVDGPVEGTVVGLSRNRLFHHVGLCVHPGGIPSVLHIERGSGVVAQSISGMRQEHWSRIEFFRWAM